jgi:hypothetical protein
MAKCTVVYYTGHRENPLFEKKIQDKLVATIGDLPLITVSQKPLSLGKNICVGEVGSSAHNAFRQLQIGAQAATTEFICTAESDYLYAPEYFQFIPDVLDRFFFLSPLYVLFVQDHRPDRFFSLKRTGDYGAMIVGREHLLRRLDRMFKYETQWQECLETQRRLHHLVRSGNSGRAETIIPSVTFKTSNNMHQRSNHAPSTNTKTIPYWGSVAEVCETYYYSGS